MDASTQSAPELELVIRRSFDAPRDLVFKAWTEPERLMQWWAPAGFSTAAFELDLRPGGAWRACLRPSDGGPDLWHQGVMQEIVPPRRLVMTHAWLNDDGTPGIEGTITVTFEAMGDKTELCMRQVGFESVAEHEGHGEGWSECFDALDRYLVRAA